MLWILAQQPILAPLFRYDPDVMGPLFTSPRAGDGSCMRGRVRACPTLVNYDLQT